MDSTVTESLYVLKQCENRTKHLDFDVETWYNWLEPVTFKTKCFALSVEQCKALITLYQHRYCSRRPATTEELTLLTGLEQSIDQAMTETCKDFQSSKFFVRLSMRSPKDASPVNPSRFQEVLQTLIADPRYGEGTSFDTNRKMVAVSDCMSDLAVSSGLDAMWLLTSSERIFTDLLVATATEELYAKHPMKVIVRAWEDRVDQRFEFRGFVSGGELTAISQYNHYCYFPEVVQRKDELRELLHSFWSAQVRDRVPLPDYIVDFAVLDGSSEVVVIELNPFATTTGGALYDWKADREVLTQGPLSFRVHESPLTTIDHYVEYIMEEMKESEPQAVDWRLPETPSRVPACTMM